MRTGELKTGDCGLCKKKSVAGRFSRYLSKFFCHECEDIMDKFNAIDSAPLLNMATVKTCLSRVSDENGEGVNKMKIVAKSNHNKDLFTETIVAENVDERYGEGFVSRWNKEFCNDQSEIYLELVDDDYVLYDGYKELL